VGVLDASTSPHGAISVSKDNILKLIQPGNVDDQLTEILRNGARALLAQAVEADVADFLGKHADLKTADATARRPPSRPPRSCERQRDGVVVSQPKSEPYGISAINNIIWYSESGSTPNTVVRFDPKTAQFQSWQFQAAGTSCATPQSRLTATSCRPIVS
jgi:hypothetical protein